MTTITYSSGGDTHIRPSLAFTAAGAPAPPLDFNNEYQIFNPQTGYSLVLFSSDHSFTEDGTNGTISEVKIEDSHGHVYADFTSLDGNTDLGDFRQTLSTSGAKAALDQIVGFFAEVTGSSDADQAETYLEGNYHLGGGNDALIITSNFINAAGEGGNDVFRIDAGGLFGLVLHGGTDTGGTGPNEINTVNFHAAGTLGFDFIEDINRFVFSSTGTAHQFIYLDTDQLPGGKTTAEFQVVGSAPGHANEIVVVANGFAADHVNLSGVTVSNFTRNNQAFFFNFANDTVFAPFNDSAVGVLNARNVFHFGVGNDIGIGGSRADIFTGDAGNDRFNGRGGVDVATFEGRSGQYTLTKVNATTWSVHDNRAGSPDGTDILINTEYAKFANTTIYIGPPPPAATPPAAPAAHHAYDLLV